MLKYAKYELKGTMKFLVGAILLALGASTGIQLFIKREAANTMNYLGGMPRETEFVAFLIVAMVFIMLGAFIGATVYLISSFRKELYEDRGYLTFSLPISGSQLLGSKLVVAVFWGLVMGVSILSYNIILAQILISSDIFRDIWSLFRYIENMEFLVVGSFLTGILETVVTILLVYFAITISRVSIRSRKIGSLWFVLFIIMSSLLSYFQNQITRALPMYLNLSTMSIVGQREAYILGVSQGMGGSISLMGLVSLPGILFQVLVAVAVFVATAYMLDHKIDLV